MLALLWGRPCCCILVFQSLLRRFQWVMECQGCSRLEENDEESVKGLKETR